MAIDFTMLAKIKEKYIERKFRKAYKTLEEDEVECAKCDGTGKDFDTAFPNLYKCRRCSGTGKTDWVTNVMGNPEEYESYRSSSISRSSATIHLVAVRRVK